MVYDIYLQRVYLFKDKDSLLLIAQHLPLPLQQLKLRYFRWAYTFGYGDFHIQVRHFKGSNMGIVFIASFLPRPLAVDWSTLVYTNGRLSVFISDGFHYKPIKDFVLFFRKLSYNFTASDAYRFERLFYHVCFQGRYVNPESKIKEEIRPQNLNALDPTLFILYKGVFFRNYFLDDNLEYLFFDGGYRVAFKNQTCRLKTKHTLALYRLDHKKIKRYPPPIRTAYVQKLKRLNQALWEQYRIKNNYKKYFYQPNGYCYAAFEQDTESTLTLCRYFDKTASWKQKFQILFLSSFKKIQRPSYKQP